MDKQVIVYSLANQVREDDVRAIFSAYGKVYKVELNIQIDDDVFMGWGFVEMDRAGAEVAIDALADTGRRKPELSTLYAERAPGGHHFEKLSFPCKACRYRDYCAYTMGNQERVKCGILDQ